MGTSGDKTVIQPTLTKQGLLPGLTNLSFWCGRLGVILDTGRQLIEHRLSAPLDPVESHALALELLGVVCECVGRPELVSD